MKSPATTTTTSTTSARRLLLWCLSSTITSTVIAQLPSSSPTSAPELFPDNCSANTGCLECVEAGCAWGIGTCLDSCNQLPELPCYARSAVNFGTSNTATAICQQQQQEARDAATCGIQEDCASCTGTRLTSVNEFATDFEEGTPTTCSWYEDQQKCAHTACDSAGSCAAPYCPDTPEGRCFFGADNCLECLQLEVSSAGGFGSTTTQPCVWSGGQCDLECQADAVCYAEDDDQRSDALADLDTVEEICEVAESSQANEQLCDAQSDNGCAACTSTIQSDGTACQYYFDVATQRGWCGTGGCDSNGVCGRDECTGVPDNPGDVVCAVLENQSRVTCAQCLNADCAWTGGEACINSCDVIADALCWDSDSGAGFSTTSSICADATDAIRDEEICDDIDTCDICTATTKSDRRSTCEWYTDDVADRSWCGTGGCDQNGVCGSVLCDSDGERGSCSTENSCSTCLQEEQCVWVGQTCQVSCNAFPNDECYSTIARPGSSVSAICNDAAFDAANQPGSSAIASFLSRDVGLVSVIIAGLASWMP